jgi:predicted NAD/FAD-binding protein
VYLYEAASRIGGHTNTVEFKAGKYKTAVDTGFIVLNSATYRKSALPLLELYMAYSLPSKANFIRFLEHVNVRTVPTEMTFGVSRNRGQFEWAGKSLGAVFCQKRNLFSLRMWRMIFDIIRFNQFALDLLIHDDENEDKDELVNGFNPYEHSIGAYLDREGYSDSFRRDYLIPMTACIWSTSPNRSTLEFPAITLVRFL